MGNTKTVKKVKKVVKVKKTKTAKNMKPALLKLNLACGKNPAPGFLGVDIVKMDGVDQVVDLTVFPWPWADGSVEEVIISHYVEHVPDLISFMNELYRILIPNGKATVTAPYWTSVRAIQDPTHVRGISEQTFLYFNQDWLKSVNIDHYNIKADFDFTYGYLLHPDIANRSEEFRAFAVAHYVNSVTDIQVIMTKKIA